MHELSESLTFVYQFLVVFFLEWGSKKQDTIFQGAVRPCSQVISLGNFKRAWEQVWAVHGGQA